jgi:hypothetical protein
MRWKLHDAVRRACEFTQGARQASLVPGPEHLGSGGRSGHDLIVGQENPVRRDDASPKAIILIRPDGIAVASAALLGRVFSCSLSTAFFIALSAQGSRTPRLPVSAGQAA